MTAPVGARGFAFFSFCWALSGLLDIAPYAAWDRSPLHALHGAACLVALLRPASTLAFAGVTALRLAVFGVDSPDTANHQVLFALVSLALLASGALAARGPGGWRLPQPGRWRACFAPALRVCLLALYGLAVLHKLNRDYLDPGVSCALFTLQEVLPAALGDWLAAGRGRGLALVWGSLAAEASVPLLIAWAPTRRAGLALGVLFHGLLGIRFFAFSSGIFALYSCFVPEAVFAAAAATAGPRLRRVAPGLGLLLVAGFSWAGAALHRGAPAPGAPQLLFAGFAALWLLGALGGTAWLLRVRSGWAEAVPGGRWGAPALLLVPLLVLQNGLSPYLGLRTVPTFSMFSNLRTEGGLSNHLFMPPRALRVASYQEDLVRVLDADAPELRALARAGRIPFWSLRRSVQGLARQPDRGDIRLVYQRGRQRVARPRAQEDPTLMAPLPWWERKWLRFRAVPLERRTRCTW